MRLGLYPGLLVRPSHPKIKGGGGVMRPKEDVVALELTILEMPEH